MDTSTLLLGTALVLVAMFVAGVAGFGMALVSLPFLLLLGLPLSNIVVVNLTLTLLTRIPILWRFHSHLDPRRVVRLLLACVPGIALGIVVIHAIATDVLKVGAGAIVLAAATYLFLRPTRASTRGLFVAPFLAGFTGGFFGATASLNGLPPALLLSYADSRAKSFLADLAAYFIVSSSLILIALFARGDLHPGPLADRLLVWLPTGLLGTFVGTRLASQIPHYVFRRVVLIVIASAGAATILTTAVR